MRSIDLPDGFVAHHHGDFSGDVIIEHQNDSKVCWRVPFEVIRAIYLGKVRSEMISRYESMSDDDLEEYLVEGC